MYFMFFNFVKTLPCGAIKAIPVINSCRFYFCPGIAAKKNAPKMGIRIDLQYYWIYFSARHFFRTFGKIFKKMITAEQLKNLQERGQALRGCL
jgi:hypothetical protein